jgi:D-3-phosphoglycerate dehydrogenase
MRTLRELTVGVVGLGRIGREVVKRLVPFGCRILVFDPIVSAEEMTKVGATAAASVEDLLPVCDVLTLHCPSTSRTRGMLNEATLGKMKRGAILINVARGNLVDTSALVRALQQRQLAMAALDVCDPEPIPAGHPLLAMPNVLLCPHIASASPRAARRLREEATHAVACALRGEVPPNIVNGVSRRG